MRKRLTPTCRSAVSRVCVFKGSPGGSARRCAHIVSVQPPLTPVPCRFRGRRTYSHLEQQSRGKGDGSPPSEPTPTPIPSFLPSHLLWRWCLRRGFNDHVRPVLPPASLYSLFDTLLSVLSFHRFPPAHSRHLQIACKGYCTIIPYLHRPSKMLRDNNFRSVVIFSTFNWIDF